MTPDAEVPPPPLRELGSREFSLELKAPKPSLKKPLVFVPNAGVSTSFLRYKFCLLFFSPGV